MPGPLRRYYHRTPVSPGASFSLAAIPRLGSLLLGTILEQQGLEVKVVIQEMTAPKYRSLDFHPDLVCISSISSTAPRAYELAHSHRYRACRWSWGAHTEFSASGRVGARR